MDKLIEILQNIQRFDYADDFIILCKTKEDAEKVYELLEDYLSERGITLSPEKTQIINLKEGFDFLGFNIRSFDTQQGDKVLAQPAKEKIKECKQKLKVIFKKYRNRGIGKLIEKANNVIRGVANFWKQGSASKAFSEIDHYLWTLTYRFLRRLHPRKSWKWIRNRYFKEDYLHERKDNYILTNPDKPKEQLLKMSWTHIRYSKMIKYSCNPYDKSYKEYIIKRFKRTPFEILYDKI